MYPLLVTETTNSVKLPEDGSSQTITNFVLSNRTKSSDSPENFLTTAQEQSNPVATVISNEEVDVKEKKTEDFEKTQTDNGNKDTRVNENLKRKEYDNKSTQTGTRKKRKRSQKVWGSINSTPFLPKKILHTCIKLQKVKARLFATCPLHTCYSLLKQLQLATSCHKSCEHILISTG